MEQNSAEIKKDTKLNIESAADTYRWYLCTQKTPLNWTCAKINTADMHTSSFIEQKSPTTLIPVYKFIPSAFDNIIVSRTMHSMTNIKIQK